MVILHAIIASIAALGSVCASTQSPLSPAVKAISPALFADLERCSRLADIAYCVTPPAAGISSPFQCLSRCAEFPHFELVTTWNTGPLLSDSAGYIAIDHELDENGNGRVVVVFRGTYSIANAIVDLSTIPQAYTPYPGENDDDDSALTGSISLAEPKCENCSVHVGFNRAWRNTRARITSALSDVFIFHPRYELSLIGHSLGGAIAMLAALEMKARGLNLTVTTFGEPRVGNEALADYVDERFDLTSGSEHLQYRRVTHIDDPVPLLPLKEWSYAMHAGEIFVEKPELKPAVQDVRYCHGQADTSCIAAQDGLSPGEDLLASVRTEIADVRSEPWGIPSRYKLWQLIFAHRDYFHRLGVCLPGGDPLRPEPTPKYDLR